MKQMAILCVDDEPTILYGLKEQLLDQFGQQYLIEIAENGEEALEVFKELQADNCDVALVISDCIMPGMPGDELLKYIHQVAPNTLNILLTGQSSTQVLVNAIKHAGLYRYVAKPWQKEDLILTVAEALKAYLKDRQLEEQNRLLQQQAIQLQEKNLRLLSLDQEKNEFLGIAAHDLKNPLAGILGVAELIQEDIAELSKDELLEYAGKIERAAKQMFGLITNLLDVNKIESGNMKVSLQLTDLLPIVQQLFSEYYIRAATKQIDLKLVYDQNRYPAIFDCALVYQVLDNLISNAIKYSPLGKPVWVRLYQTEQHVLCEVQNEGLGFSPSDLQKLFHKFNRLSAKPTGGEHSTGLGLFIVKKLIDAMAAQIWCESEPGRGAKFVVKFAMP